MNVHNDFKRILFAFDMRSVAEPQDSQLLQAAAMVAFGSALQRITFVFIGIRRCMASNYWILFASVKLRSLDWTL